MSAGGYGRELESRRTFCAFGGGGELLGQAPVSVEHGGRPRGLAILTGIFVKPTWRGRGRGIGRALLERVVDDTRCTIRALHVTVAASDGPAMRLLLSAGFEEFGVAKQAGKDGQGGVDVHLMTLVFGRW